MIEKLKDGRYHVLVTVHLAGKKEHTIPCPKIHCPICARLRGNPVDRDFAGAIESEFKNQLKAKRKGSATSIVLIRDALSYYADRRGGIPAKDKSTYNRLLDQIGANPIESSWHALLAFKEAQEAAEELAPASINRHLQMAMAAIARCYNDRDAKGNELVPKNYLHGFPLLEEHNIHYVILWNQEIDTYWNALDDRLKPLWYYSSCVPVREGEAINIRRSMVDMEARTIKFEGGYQKNKRVRMLDIPEGMMAYFRRWYLSGAEYVFNRGPEQNYLPLGYIDGSGKVRYSLKTQIERAAAAVGKPDYTVHKWRQQAVMSMAQDGMNRDRIMFKGSWKTPGAFEHYYDAETADRIMDGKLTLDVSWKWRLAPWFEGKPIVPFTADPLPSQRSASPQSQEGPEAAASS